MATHISARLAWHDNGWNGTVCRNPRCNTFCSGPHSYPGEKIADGKDLAYEESCAGQFFESLERLPPCLFSAQAFSPRPGTMFDDPPAFFRGGSRVSWQVPAYTTAVWPYEEMYRDEAKTNGKDDAVKRLDLVNRFFAEVEPGKSLVFHYAAHSNPFSTEDAKRYVLVGVSRISQLSDLYYYGDLTPEIRKTYGGFVWEKAVTVDFENQGFRIPYHIYQDRPDVLERLAVFPDNDRCFKYASRHMTDDDALGLVERFIEVAAYLREDLKDTSENWTQRLEWLSGLVGELWRSRGLYPGFSSFLEELGLAPGIPMFRKAVLAGQETNFVDQTFQWLVGPSAGSPDWVPEASPAPRKWKLIAAPEQSLIREVLIRLDVPLAQFRAVLSENRSDHGLEHTATQIVANPFVLAEAYQGSGPDDQISVTKVENAVFPSPSLASTFLMELDDGRRLRAHTMRWLKAESSQCFLSQGVVLQRVNEGLSRLPEWKRVTFRDQYFVADQTLHEETLVFRTESGRPYVYLRSVYEAERRVAQTIRDLAARPAITFKSPVRRSDWETYLTKTDSRLNQSSSEEYAQAIGFQAGICEQVFNRPVSVICGSAGTGKTTVVESLIKAIEKAHGRGTVFKLLAPTGKAADRLREKTGKDASTVHSFLAQLGWLRPNLSLKPTGGRQEAGVSTFIIDESSMLDLEFFAAVVKAINWNSVQRLILVGDPNQLPPIGRGRVFADTIAFLSQEYPDHVGTLTVNLRQMENRAEGRGTSLLRMADLFVHRDASPLGAHSGQAQAQAEDFLQKLQDLPEDGSVDQDLRVLFWQDATQLQESLIRQMIADMEQDSGLKYDPDAPWSLWQEAWKTDGTTDPLYQQILSPYRNEDYGTNVLNEAIQEAARGDMKRRVGHLAGITLFDKVMQIRNRGASDAIEAYNWDTRSLEKANVFNGELGMVNVHGYDSKTWKGSYFRLKKFAVKFARKDHLSVNYGKLSENKSEPVEENLELAYAISVHKAQGSEFQRVYFVLPQKANLLSAELLYTGLTRASRHCTIFIEKDLGTVFRMHRPESSQLLRIGSSLFTFRPVPDELVARDQSSFLEQYRIHRSLADVMVRSKSEVIIANLLFEREIPFEYEKPLYAPDGSFYLPDFTVTIRGQVYYWEHLGLLDQTDYRVRWENKRKWYERFFPGQLVTTEESGNLSVDAAKLLMSL